MKQEPPLTSTNVPSTTGQTKKADPAPASVLTTVTSVAKPSELTGRVILVSTRQTEVRLRYSPLPPTSGPVSTR